MTWAIVAADPRLRRAHHHREDGGRRAAAERLRRRAARPLFTARCSAGFHILLPFVDVIRYRHSLKETAIDIPAQVCITRDNVQVGVDGVLYLKVLNPERASYGISDYIFAITQLRRRRCAARSARSISTRRSRSARTSTLPSSASSTRRRRRGASRCCATRSRTSRRPHDILAAMEKQMRAEREKRAVILTSEGTRDAAINTAEGEKQEDDQGVGSAAGSSRSTKPKVRRRRSWRSRPRRPRASAGRRSHQAAGRPRGGAAARGRAVHRAVRRAGEEEQHDHAAGQRGGRRLDDGAGDETGQERRLRE